MVETREYVITKISDQKDKKYDIIRELEVGDNGLPTQEELDAMIDIEDNKKNVALFIGYDYITKICYKSFSKFKRVMLEEYIKGYTEGLYSQVYFDTVTEKRLEEITAILRTYREEYSYKNIVSDNGYQRSRN